MGIRDRPISPGSPWQNGYAERLIGTLRRECLDQVVIFGATHLRQFFPPMRRIIMKRTRSWHQRKMPFRYHVDDELCERSASHSAGDLAAQSLS
jgi:transposase InsO family protein